jgi:hypothetical protein
VVKNKKLLEYLTVELKNFAAPPYRVTGLKIYMDTVPFGSVGEPYRDAAPAAQISILMFNINR